MRITPTECPHLVESADVLRIEACRGVPEARRSELGQFLTPPHVARRMAGMLAPFTRSVRLLDPGAGVGVLTCACIEHALDQAKPPQEIEIVAFELEQSFHCYLERVFQQCGEACAVKGIKFDYRIEGRDFIDASVDALTGDALFECKRLGDFTHAITNPPYRKLNTDSRERLKLREAGIETSNYYAAFVWLADLLLAPGGEVAFITPRSFCNGPYFLPFRRHLVSEMAMRQIHVFESRDTAFDHDEVLQENVIVHAARSTGQPHAITIHSSEGGTDDDVATREVEFGEVVNSREPQLFIHVVPCTLGARLKEQVEALPSTLEALSLAVSTGRVVDFRAGEVLRQSPSSDAAPLIYPHNLANGEVVWPVASAKKASAIEDSPKSDDVLNAAGIYVLAKRFSSKEERRRVVAAVYDPAKISTPSARVGFENHLNYFHAEGKPLPMALARGLCAFLNSSLVDEYFRQFNGHTQVNASDLRKLRYPSRSMLEALGNAVASGIATQAEIDTLVHQHLELMPDASEPIAAKSKIDDAQKILRGFGVPREQQNERSALTLLALLDLKPNEPWTAAQNPLRGITELMDFIRDDYGKTYAPNTRETIRRRTVHQFVQVGLLVENPDKPSRPINSPNWVYQVEANALRVIRLYGTDQWTDALAAYLQQTDKIRKLQTMEREMQMVPVTMPDGRTLQLSQGGQNTVIKAVLEQFCPRFTPGAVVLYVGDAGQKFIVNEVENLARLGVTIDEHGKMPDVVVHYRDRNWVVLIEAVTSHGPVDLKRHNELRALFSKCTAGLVFVTAFPSRREMNKYLADIAWETEVWVADAPTHLIHFNGERFLGPYEPLSKDK